MKKQFLILFAFISVLAFSQAPQRFNKVVVTGDITSPKFIKTGSTADSVLLGNGSARAISTIKTDTVSLSNRINAKAAGNGTANGTNTGDETLTSIKTKLGAATSVSDGYLKYQDYVKFDGKLSSEVDGSTTNELQTISTNGAAGNITLSNSGGTLNLNVNDDDASAANEIQDISLSGNTLTLSSDATTVNISQATAVLANTAKVSNATHTGDVTGSTALTLKTVNSNVGTFNNITINAKGLATAGSNVSYEPSFSKNTAFNKNFGTTPGTVLEGRTFGTAAGSAVGDFYAVGATVSNSTNFGSLSIDKFVHGTNSIATNASNGIDINTITPSAAFYTGYNNSNTPNSNTTDYGYLNIPLWSGLSSSDKSSIQIGGTYGYGTARIRVTGATGAGNWYNIYHSGNLTNTLSTNYIPKWNGSNFVNATAGTDYQLPITLTTNGTSGAATFSGNVLNVPNYAASGGVNQTQTTVNGSVNGNAICSMPFQTSTYKKVIILLGSFSGSLTYTFPTPFLFSPNIYTGAPGISPATYSITTTSLTLSGGSNTNGWVTLEGF